MWVRGLKHTANPVVNPHSASHPMWVRGLKQKQIENFNQKQEVAPYVGAWIETNSIVSEKDKLPSHPMWVRGLKRKGSLFRLHNVVAPYVGAWIETSTRV